MIGYIANSLNVSFTNSSTGTVGGFSCTWNFGDGNSSNNCDPNHTYTAAGTYIYYATQTVNGCESPDSAVVLTIHTIPGVPVANTDTVDTR